jgi:hypothetical protein
VNGDGQADLSDAVYLLNWLFLGGPEPQCPASNGAPAGLPETGQTTCYSDGDPANEIRCDSGTFHGQDGFYETGCPPEGRFVATVETVTDNCTGLMWQKDTADTNDDWQIDEYDRLAWRDALAYCEELSFVGHDDWRLPNVRELQSIVDYGRDHPAVDPVFESTMSWYWSSSTLVVTPADAWGVCFGYGGAVQDFGKTGTYYVRAVRTIQPGE